MTVDFTKPTAGADRAQNLTDTKDNAVALAKMLDDTTPTGVATGMVRWSTTNNKWQKYNGSSWVDLASTYAINVSSFNGQSASYYTAIAARLGYTPVNKAGDTMTGALVLNADPSATLGAATKGYVDTGLATKSASSHAHAWSALTSQLATDGTDTTDPSTTTQGVMVTNHANSPLAGVFWTITTVHHSANYKSQIAVEMAAAVPRVYARSKNSGTWYAWVRCDLGEGATRSIVANGYATIPGTGGLIKQWGKFTRASGTHAVTFPTTFPNAWLSVVQSDMYASTLNDSSRVTAVTNSGFTSSRGDSTSFDVMFQAIGY